MKVDFFDKDYGANRLMKMFAIIGTVVVPENYSGFETLAENLAHCSVAGETGSMNTAPWKTKYRGNLT